MTQHGLPSAAGRALAATLLALAAVPSHGLPSLPTFEITAFDCPGPSPRVGSGFLAEDWTEAGGHLLLTSLHVVDSCEKVQIVAIACTPDGRQKNGAVFDVPRGRELRVWPSHDLAAIPILEGDPLARVTDVPPGRLTFEATRPEPLDKVVILGRDVVTFCPFASGEVLYSLRASDVSTHLASQMGSTVAEMQGSLDSEAFLMVYNSVVGPGASGAPVLQLRGPEVVLGVHIAGYEGKHVSWSILLGRLDDLVTEPVRHPLGQSPWPAYDAPGLRQSAYLEMTPEVNAAVLAYQRRQLEAYEEVAKLFKGVTFWSREVLIRYDRYAGDAARLVPHATDLITFANQHYEPFGQQINTGAGDTLRASLTALWGPVMAYRYDQLFDEAVAIHREAMFPTSEINQLIRDAATSRRGKQRKIAAIESISRERRLAYEPRVQALRQQAEALLARLEKGLRKLGILEPSS